VLAAVTVLGIGVTGLMAALGTMATTTQSNRSQTREHDVMVSATEYVKAAPLTAAAGGLGTPATVCAAGSPTSITTLTLPTGFSATYGPGTVAVSGVACPTLVSIPVRVTGDGYDQTVYVVRRP
jgi:hypothetical protein